MAKPRKYNLGPRIQSVDELQAVLLAGSYIIVKRGSGSEKRTHPSWALSWPLRLCISEIERGALYRAVPNPEHPKNQENTNDPRN